MLKSRIFLFGIVLVFLFASCTDQKKSDVNLSSSFTMPDGVTFVEHIEPNASDAVVIPYKKFKLDNGLSILLHKDTSDPLVHVDVTYHVGSGREEPGKSGFAHFFEHMMFQGSENVADDEHFKIVSEVGGTMNGTTNPDRTNYFQTVPSNQLEKMLWLEADRMGYFLDAVTQEKFEVQRETVKNERAENYDNRPYGLVSERFNEALYPVGHPYNWPTIGYIDDLNRASLTDLKKFFLKWYGPNNAVLTIGGDIDEAQTLAWIKRYFGTIPSGPEHADPKYVPVILDQNRYISLEDDIQMPLIYMGWPTVHETHPDEAPLDVLANILGQGKTSIMYQNLQKPGLAVQVSSSHGCQEVACTFVLSSFANSSKIKKLSELEAAFMEALIEFESRGASEDDLERVKNSILSQKIYGLESVRGKVSQLALYETYRNDANGIGDDIERYENVTQADVMRVYKQYIKDKPAVIMSTVPEGQSGMIVQPDNWTPNRVVPDAREDRSEDFQWTRPTDPEGLDRSIMPSVGTNDVQVKPPATYEFTMENGLHITGAVNTEVPTTTIAVRIGVGQAHETLETLGLANLTKSLLSEATQRNTAEDLSNELAKLGSYVSFSSGDTYTTMNIRSLTDNLDKTLAIAVEKLLMPKFDQADFERIQTSTVKGIESREKDTSAIASNIFERLVYGADNPTSYPLEGLKETVQSLTVEQVEDFYKTHYSPKVTKIIAVSNLDAKEMETSLRSFSVWNGGDVDSFEFNPFPTPEAGKIYFVDKPGAAQSEIRIGKRSLTYDATGEYFRAGIMNYPLGGVFSSRLNLNLREDKGYTYGVRSFFSGDKNRGWYQVSTSVRRDATADAIVEIIQEIQKYHAEGATQAELDFTRSSLSLRDARAYETPRQKLRFLTRMVTYNLKPEFVEEQANILETIPQQEIAELAKKHLDMSEMIIVVTGDKAKVYDDLITLGYPVSEVDLNGNPI